MPNEVQEFAHEESLQDRESIVRHLSVVGEGLQKGQLQHFGNGERFSLETRPLLKFDVQAKQKRNRGQLVLKMSWKNPKSATGLKVKPLRIDAGSKRD